MHCLRSDFTVSIRHGIFLALSGIDRMYVYRFKDILTKGTLLYRYIIINID